MTHNIWSKEKPILEEECLLLTADNFSGEYEYKIFEIKKIDGGDGWYFGILDQGSEWGDYEDLHVEYYFTMYPFLGYVNNATIIPVRKLTDEEKQNNNQEFNTYPPESSEYPFKKNENDIELAMLNPTPEWMKKGIEEYHRQKEEFLITGKLPEEK